VYEVTPSPTNVREFAPPKLDIPSILLTQSIVAEYGEEYIVVDRIDSRVMYGVPWSFGCWNEWN
jgi:hypothetical protein